MEPEGVSGVRRMVDEEELKGRRSLVKMLDVIVLRRRARRRTTRAVCRRGRLGGFVDEVGRVVIFFK